MILTGAIGLKEGYQMKIGSSGSVISLSARKGNGIPIGCNTSLYSIINDCSNIISYFNGVGVSGNLGDFVFKGGDNIAIFNDKDNHRIYIGLTFKKEDTCQSVLTPAQ